MNFEPEEGVPISSGNVTKPSLEWMYKPSALVDREDYLLGRTVDKSLKILEEAEKGNNTFNYADEVEKDLTPLSIFKSQGSGPIDVIKKIKDDPLYQIQKKEEESLKQLLRNPVRMKELEERVRQRQQQQHPQKKKKSKTKSKKGKIEKKRRRRGSSSDSDSESDDDNSTSAPAATKAFKDIDKLLSAKLQSLKKKSKKRSKSRESSSDASSSSGGSDSHKKRRKTDSGSGSQPQSRSRSTNDDHSRDCRDPRRDSYDRRRTDDRNNRDRDRRPWSRHNDDDNSRSQNRRSEQSYRQGSRDRDPPRDFKRPSVPEPKRISKTMNEDDLEKKRREMMENAKWRDEQRTKSVNQYRSEEQKEKEELEKKRDPDFIRKQLMEAASSGSVEKRIKSNSYNLQRGKGTMDQNFVRR